jgi:hypothetical protein
VLNSIIFSLGFVARGLTFNSIFQGMNYSIIDAKLDAKHLPSAIAAQHSTGNQ